MPHTQEFIDSIKKDLQTEQNNLRTELQRIAEKDINNPTNWKSKFPNLGDSEEENAQEVELYGERLSLEQTLENKLRDVDAALVRIKQGEYGLCRHCGQSISEERLRARPESSSCIDCKKSLKKE